MPVKNEHLKPHNKSTPLPLDMCVVRNGGDRLWDVFFHADNMRFPRANSLSLQVDVSAIRLRLTPLCGIKLDAVDEVFSRTRVPDMLNTDADALLDIPSTDTLVNDDSEGRLGHVEDDTSLTVVDLVWHTSQFSILADKLVPEFALTPSEQHH